jgi:hypothetical protein
VIFSSHPTAAKHAEPLIKPVHCVHQVAASDSEPDINSTPPASPLSEPVVAPAELPYSPPLSSCCATCCLCICLAVDLQPPPAIDSAAPVSILDETDIDVNWQVNLLTLEVLRTIWHQRLRHIFSCPCTSTLLGCPTCLSACMAKRVTHSCVIISATHFTALLFVTRHLPSRDIFKGSLHLRLLPSLRLRTIR